MEDNVSIKSSDSVTTSGEYEIVPELIDCAGGILIPGIEGGKLQLCGGTTSNNSVAVSENNKPLAKSPQLHIINGGFLDLENNLNEVINELDAAKLIKYKTSESSMNHPQTTATTSGSINHTFPPSEVKVSSSMLLPKPPQPNDVDVDVDDKNDDENIVPPFLITKATFTEMYSLSPQTPPPIVTTTTTTKSSTNNQTTTANTIPSTFTTTTTVNTTTTIVAGTVGGISPVSCSTNPPTPETNKVGQSVFYDCIDLSPTTAEKQDDMKPERSDTEEEMSEIDQDCTIFAGVTYFGAVAINAPKSEIEILRNMVELNALSEANSNGIKVSVSIPVCSEGLVVLYDAATNAVITHFEVQRILFYARGPVNSVEQACFAFTWSHGDSQESAVFQCHVFKCLIPEAVTQVSTCFSKAFQRVPASLTGSIISPAVDNNVGGSGSVDVAAGRIGGSNNSGSGIQIGTNPMITSITSDVTGNPITSAEYEFIVSLEIREKDTKNIYNSVPRDRSCFRLRCNTDKEVAISVKQTQSNKLPPLFIERCFGVLLSPGKLVRQGDMQLLDMITMGYLKVDQSHSTATPSSSSAAAAAAAATSTATTSMNQHLSSMTSSNINIPPTHIICLNPYVIFAEWKANDKNFERLNVESAKMFITIGVDLVIKGIQEPVRFVIETPVTILAHNEIRIMDHFFTGSKKSLLQRFYLQLKDNGKSGWIVNSIDPSEEIVEQPTTTTTNQNSLLRNFGINSFSRMVRSTSTVSIEDESPTDYSSDGDEPLLSGTGEVSRDCSQDTLDEWGPVLQEWEADKRPKNLAHLVRLSVPEALRGKVWQKLANVENDSEMADKYRVLLTKETKCETVIQRDIHRTFPAHKDFRESGGAGQDSLFKVSKAYAVYDLEVGYCQGLSFIAASLLLHMPEEEAFCVLVSLMYEYGLRDLYKHGFENLYLRLYQLNRLMKSQLPKLYEHFERTGVESHMFASQWFLTLFTARFPLYFVFHILDVFLLDGMPILFQVALTLLSICEADLLKLDFEGILKYMRVVVPKKCRSAGHARKIMKMACERKVKKLKQYSDEFISAKEVAEKEDEINKQHDLRFAKERLKLKAETVSVQERFDKEIEKNRIETEKTKIILLDYKKIIQQQESEITKINNQLKDVTEIISKCTSCSSSLPSSLNPSATPYRKTQKNYLEAVQLVDAPLGPLDPLNVALQRVRELELELAQTKLAHVEAECKNQDLNHQLSLTENQSQRNSWQPWLSKTINTIQEKVTTRRDVPTFQSYTTASSTAPVDLLVSPIQQDRSGGGSAGSIGGVASTQGPFKPKLQTTNSLNRNCYDIDEVLKPPFSRNSLK